VRHLGVWLLLGCTTWLFGCEYVRPTMNAPLARWDEAYGYRSTNLPPPNTSSSDSLFIVASFSGGGTRASALAYGVLQELARTSIRWEGIDKRLVDELNIINALSGGSFTAAYYGLYGDRIFQDFEHRFLRKTGRASCGLGFFVPPPIGSDFGLLILVVPISFLSCWMKRCSPDTRSATWSPGTVDP
jgi:NTE family protein